MNFDWYLITNLDEFIATGLVSRTISVVLPTGAEDVLLTGGNLVSVLFQGVFLPVGMNGDNPFVMDERAVFYDADGLLWLGILNEG